MMRDYKFKQTEWPTRKKSTAPQKILARVAIILAVVAIGYTAYRWLPSSEMLPAPEVETDPNIIPLELPPNPVSSTSQPLSSETESKP